MLQRHNISFLVSLLAIGSTFACPILSVEPNNTLATAQNVDPYFSIEPNANVENSATTPTVNISGFGDSGNDWDFYRFTATAGSAGIFDIDNGMDDLDSWLNLFNGSGSLITSNDDAKVDPGSTNSFDSRLYYNFNQTGQYVIGVGRFPGLGLTTGQDYTLNITLENHSVMDPPQAVPEPGSLALLGLGLAGLGFVAKRRKKA